jgi:hypothetical protein
MSPREDGGKRRISKFFRFPDEFEFNQDLLEFLMDSIYDTRFVNFQCDSQFELERLQTQFVRPMFPPFPPVPPSAVMPSPSTQSPFPFPPSASVFLPPSVDNAFPPSLSFLLPLSHQPFSARNLQTRGHLHLDLRSLSLTQDPIQKPLLQGNGPTEDQVRRRPPDHAQAQGPLR